MFVIKEVKRRLFPADDLKKNQATSRSTDSIAKCNNDDFYYSQLMMSG